MQISYINITDSEITDPSRVNRPLLMKFQTVSSFPALNNTVRTNHPCEYVLATVLGYLGINS